MKIKEESQQTKVDITDLYFNFKEKYRNVFVYRLGEFDFIYRALGRKEFKEICEDKRFNDFEKEEIICDQCVLYPKNFDWESCDAGIPTALLKNILKNSYMETFESRSKVLSYYRVEMNDLDNQITAIIAEAFNIDIEKVEQWDVEKTMKYFSRAEWTLHNLRGVPFKTPDQTPTDINTMQHVAKQKNNKDTTIRGGSKQNKLTPEKLQELQQKFPEIDWTHDDGALGIQGLEQTGVDTESPALRPGFY